LIAFTFQDITTNEMANDEMLYLPGLLHCSGEFKIWTP